MKTRTLILAALAFVSLSASAQKQKKVVDRVDQRTEQVLDHQDVTVKFKSHAFVTLQGGMQYTLGEAKFGDLLSPNFQLGIGYQFSPVLAARLQANGLQSKGGWNAIGNPARKEVYKWNYVAPGLDFMFNLSNLFCGYNPTRVFNVTAFLGGGLNLGSGNDEINELAPAIKDESNYELEYLWDGSKMRPFARGGVELAFRLCSSVSLLVEGNANVLSDKYNSKKAGNADWYFNALAGLRFNLGKTTVTETKDVYREVIHTDTIYKYVTIEEPKPIKIEPIRRNIFFELNKWDILDTEWQKIKDLADFLKKNPKAKVSMVGYADVETGNDRINTKLSEERVNAVKDVLVNDYGIAADRISTDFKGSTEQPFEVNEQNRVTIAIATVD